MVELGVRVGERGSGTMDVSWGFGSTAERILFFFLLSCLRGARFGFVKSWDAGWFAITYVFSSEAEGKFI